MIREIGTVLIQGREFHLSCNEGDFTPSNDHLMAVVNDLVKAHIEHINPHESFTLSKKGLAVKDESFTHEAAKAGDLWAKLFTEENKEITPARPSIDPINPDDYTEDDFISLFEALDKNHFRRDGLSYQHQKMHDEILAIPHENLSHHEMLRAWLLDYFDSITPHEPAPRPPHTPTGYDTDDDDLL